MSREIIGGREVQDVVILDPQTAVPISSRYSTLLDYDASNNLIYIGVGQAGSNTSLGIWFIRKLTWTSGNLVSILCANGKTTFDQVWDNRAGLSYS